MQHAAAADAHVVAALSRYSHNSSFSRPGAALRPSFVLDEEPAAATPRSPQRGHAAGRPVTQQSRCHRLAAVQRLAACVLGSDQAHRLQPYVLAFATSMHANERSCHTSAIMSRKVCCAASKQCGGGGAQSAAVASSSRAARCCWR